MAQAVNRFGYAVGLRGLLVGLAVSVWLEMYGKRLPADDTHARSEEVSGSHVLFCRLEWVSVLSP